jgi:hypothetical protein
VAKMRKRSAPRPSAKLKQQSLDEALDYVRRECSTIVYCEAGGEKPFAVLVPVDDEETVDAIEDVLDARAAEKALAAMRRRGDKPILYKQARKKLGLG